MSMQNELLRSAYQVAKRSGTYTNWDALANGLENELVRQSGANIEDEQQVLRSTCTPKTFRIICPGRDAALFAVSKERARQDDKWGGPKHDDQHTTAEYIQWIEDYAGWARMMSQMESHDKARRRLIQVAALAVAAVESIDRKFPGSAPQ